MFAGEASFGFTGGHIEGFARAVGHKEIVEILVKRVIVGVAIATVEVDIDLTVELPVLEPLRFEAEACAAGLDVIAPDAFVVAGIFVVGGVEAVTAGFAVNSLKLKAPLERELLENRVGVVLVEVEGRPGLVHRGFADEFADQQAGGVIVGCICLGTAE